MPFVYQTEGVCPVAITVTLEGDVIKEVQFDGGCDGNLKAIGAIVKGMTIWKVRDCFLDIVCEDKNTSCSAQLVKAVFKAYESVENSENNS